MRIANYLCCREAEMMMTPARNPKEFRKSINLTDNESIRRKL